MPSCEVVVNVVNPRQSSPRRQEATYEGTNLSKFLACTLIDSILAAGSGGAATNQQPSAFATAGSTSALTVPGGSRVQ